MIRCQAPKCLRCKEHSTFHGLQLNVFLGKVFRILNFASDELEPDKQKNVRFSSGESSIREQDYSPNEASCLALVSDLYRPNDARYQAHRESNSEGISQDAKTLETKKPRPLQASPQVRQVAHHNLA